MNDFPRVLVVTHQSVCRAHGTGAVLLRHFGRYDPRKLASVYLTNDGEPPWACNVKAEKRIIRRWSLPWVENLFWRLARRLGRRAEREFAASGTGRRYERVRPALKAAGFFPDLIYANCFGQADLALVLQLLREFKRKIPVVQHFQDYEPDAKGILQKLLPRCDEVWALGSGIANELEAQFGCRAEIVNTFKAIVPQEYKREHQAADKSLRVVIIGNVYYPSIFKDVRRLWQYVQTRLPEIGPIEWMAHPLQVQNCAALKIAFEPEVKYVGFKDPEQLHDELLHADVAVIPFNQGALPENGYSRYSIPSRITELAMAGLPIFCMAGPGTDARRFVEHHGIGMCANGSEGAVFFQKFWELLSNPELRATLGRRARYVAEKEFNLEDYQGKLYGRLREIAGGYRSHRRPE